MSRSTQFAAEGEAPQSRNFSSLLPRFLASAPGLILAIGQLTTSQETVPRILAFLVAVAVVVRSARISIEATTHELVVKNFFLTHRLSRHEIRRFESPSFSLRSYWTAVTPGGGILIRRKRHTAPRLLVVSASFGVEEQCAGFLESWLRS